MKYLYTLIIFLLSLSLFSQDPNLAKEYYLSGEYEKAAIQYYKLYEKSNFKTEYYFTQYIQCLLADENYTQAEKDIKDQIKKRPQDVQLYVTYGNLYESQYLPEKADKEFRRAIDNLPNDRGVIQKLGSAFVRLTKYDLAEEAYLKGSKLLNDENIFAYYLADLYRRKGDTKQMIKYYLLTAGKNAGMINNLKTNFQRYLTTPEQYDELKLQLFEKSQNEPSNLMYQELLEWLYIQQENYNKAFAIARSLDIQSEADGAKVMNIGRVASNAKDYNTAVKAFEYITEEKGSLNTYYFDAKNELLTTKRKKLLQNYNYTSADMDSLSMEYKVFLDEFGINTRTAYITKQYGDFLAIYKNDLPEATKVLTNLVEMKGLNKHVIANAKLSLADYLLMQGDIWESTLYYSQVDKEFKEEFLGEQARFKNALLSYYNGDFEWAQAQFDILKSATSRLISNDAIDLSVFIMDNLNLDTTAVPLKMYAEADLLVFQNKFDQAFGKLDSIMVLFPEHSLDDDIAYTKANIFQKLKQYDKAVESYNFIIEKYPEEVRADNAIFELAELYDNVLQDDAAAEKLYEKLFLDYSNSTFAVESRKRYRIMRGDDIQ